MLPLSLCALVQLVQALIPALSGTWPGCCTYPSLANATSDELQNGLQNGCFTSVDLVNVCCAALNDIELPHVLTEFLGICGKDPRG